MKPAKKINEAKSPKQPALFIIIIQHPVKSAGSIEIHGRSRAKAFDVRVRAAYLVIFLLTSMGMWLRVYWRLYEPWKNPINILS